jgi:NADH-quinone oxidoreductase subunit F
MESREHWILPDEPYESYTAYRGVWQSQAIEQARSHEPERVLRQIQRSGLRGRGGAGFPTGTKWATVAQHECPTRQVVCNAAEGEPGTFKDRWLIRHNPYAVLEGMLIAAHVVGAEKIYIALKASFEKEATRLRAAIEDMADVIGDIEVSLVLGPEEYLFGEERALLEVIEGNEPLPREAHYPPYEKGLFATPLSPNPAIVNNAETYAHVPSIIRNGAASFRELGTSDTPGTLLFTISGDVKRPGVYEREAGITLHEMFYDVAGGPKEGRRFKAALSGVASSILTPDRFAARADFGSMQMVGSGLGSCGFILIDDATSMPRVVQAVARFLYVESCNQCSACKHGLRTASEAIDELFDPATATADDSPRALYGARSAPQGNRCYLPVQGSIMVPSILRAYSLEFDAQLQNPSKPSEPWPIPKLVDYDPATHSFLIDEHQQFKTPEWTYDEPPQPVQSIPPPAKHRPVERPHDADEALFAVRLAPDVAAAMRVRADVRGRSFDALVNEVLRDWLDD